ncbi:hypothetical protein H8K32_08655 [Undibacterium jejuense]|uniref:FlgO domain-containing protein n=1 Tax=Undibacterium jejuense TaxID=1344949 RepID=A0A923HE89_9BURK|nr:hypothetical protein [Undibacterium jejuense]MBC3862164.1 hypothetical protein [Undibacterium jejuense]
MKKLLPVAVAAMLLAGCSTPFYDAANTAGPAAEKPSELHVASNWLLIAKDVANQIKIGTDKIGAPVFVTPPNDGSKFAQAFYNQVVTSLVNQGVTVRKFSDGTAQIVDIDTQLVRFSSDKTENRHFLGISGFGSSTSGSEAQPTYEVIVTTSLIKNSQYVTRRTDAYPVNEYDASLYNKDAEFKFKITGGQ